MIILREPKFKIGDTIYYRTVFGNAKAIIEEVKIVYNINNKVDYFYVLRNDAPYICAEKDIYGTSEELMKKGYTRKERREIKRIKKKMEE